MPATRRDVLTGGLMLALATTTSAALPLGDRAGLVGLTGLAGLHGLAGLPELDDPAARLRSLVRLQGSLDESEVPWWYTGLVFAVSDEPQPRPLFRFEGMEIHGFKRVADGYALGGRAVTYFRDLVTNDYLYDFHNPWTGRPDRVEPVAQGGAVGCHYSTSGIVPIGSDGERLPPPSGEAAPAAAPLRWNASREHVWLEQQTVYPAGMPAMHAQHQAMFTSRTAFANERLVALPATFSATVFSGWPRWLGARGRPGHLVWHASGAKLRSFAELPRDYLARVEREFPATLNARHANQAAMGFAMAATDDSE